MRGRHCSHCPDCLGFSEGHQSRRHPDHRRRHRPRCPPLGGWRDLLDRQDLRQWGGDGQDRGRVAELLGAARDRTVPLSAAGSSGRLPGQGRLRQGLRSQAATRSGLTQGQDYYKSSAAMNVHP